VSTIMHRHTAEYQQILRHRVDNFRNSGLFLQVLWITEQKPWAPANCFHNSPADCGKQGGLRGKMGFIFHCLRQCG